jgi:hypothetical protein
MNNSQVDEGRVSPRARVDLGAAGAIITDSPSPILGVNSSDAACPSANAGTAAAIIAGMDFTGDDGRKPVPAGEYPVPDRSEQMNRRIASHEIGHCFSARALGNNVFAVTIIPDRRPGLGRRRKIIISMMIRRLMRPTRSSTSAPVSND